MNIFLDNGGVISDGRHRPAQWQRWLGEFMPPRLGGVAADWARANRVVAAELHNSANWLAREQRYPRYAYFDRHYHLDWLRGMCAVVGVAPPAGEQACFELAVAATEFVTPR